MKNGSKRIPALLLCLCMTLPLAACSQGTENAADNAGNDAGATAAIMEPSLRRRRTRLRVSMPQRPGMPCSRITSPREATLRKFEGRGLYSRTISAPGRSASDS